MEFDGFPEDGMLWVIKWIDGFRQHRRRSKSQSVDVLLERLDISSKRQIGSIRAESLFFRPFDGQPERSVRVAKIHAESLPSVRIGQVYQAGTLVGTVTTTSQSLLLADGEEPAVSVDCAQELEKPEGWTMPFRLLNPSQFDLPYELRQSRCLLYRSGNLDVVIPRTLLLQSIYIPHTVLAEAFMAGPWDEVKRNLIYPFPMESGICTGIDPVTGTWNIVVETRVLDVYAALLALLNFDEHAQRCARQIHSSMLKDRGGNSLAVAFADARLPFKGPTRLRLSGYMLKRIARKGSDTFLASNIDVASFPDYVPEIAADRRNSGQTGEDSIPVDEPAPFGGSRSSRRAPDGTLIEATNNANSDKGTHAYESIGMEWENPPVVRSLSKGSSKRYQPASRHRDDETDSVESTAVLTSEVNADRKALMESRQLAGPSLFNFLMTELDLLKRERFIDSFRVLPPSDQGARTFRGGLECWNFLTDKMRLTGRIPRRHWVMLFPNRKGAAYDPNLVPRCALVIEIVIAGRYLLWIEIEPRENEHGRSSPVLIDTLVDDRESMIDEMLQTIAEDKGRYIKSTVEDLAIHYPPTRASFYTHSYKRSSVDGSLATTVDGLNADGLRNFLASCARSTPVQI